MIIIKVQGGLGNQMFQYALYRQLELMDKEVYLDIHGYEQYNKHNGFELMRVFRVNPKFADLKQISSLANSNKTLLQRAINKIYKKPTHYIEKNFAYNPAILSMDKVYLDGYWQTEKYFQNAAGEIINDFMGNSTWDQRNKETQDEILSSCSVSMHIRRGDYIDNPTARRIYGGIADIQYYKKAINVINKYLSSVKFFIFSDDIEWVKNSLPINNSIIIDWNTGQDSFKDLLLMAYCKHNIIANSSFSWWGAWLNQNKDKMVIAPEKWFNTIQSPDIWCKDWIKIDSGNIGD